MRKEDTLVLSFSLAMLVFCLVYTLAISIPAYYPLERLWRWEKLPGLPAMSWYARFGWSLIACALTALVSHHLLPRLLARWPTARLHRLSLLAWVAALLMYGVAAARMIHHEVQAFL